MFRKITFGEKQCSYLKGKKQVDLSEKLNKILNINKNLKNINICNNSKEFLNKNQEKLILKENLLPLIHKSKNS